MQWEPWLYECCECHRMVDERIETVWNAVHGWEKKRDAGGTNAISLRRPQNTFMCDGCMTKARAGLDPAQQDLWSLTDA